MNISTAPHILVVDDDQDVRELVCEYLGKNDMRVSAACSGKDMFALFDKEAIDLVLLDLKLPGEDGLSLARYLRERHDVAIIMVTASDAVVDRVVGLEVGADDYIAKPFDLRELLARVKSVLRRAQREPPAAAAEARRTVKVGSCALDLSAHRMLDATGAEIPLTSMEFDLLRVFVEHPNQVLSRDQLLSLTRNREWEPFDRSIDIRIARLRRKLEVDPEKPQLIKTVRGAGYCYVPAK